MKTIEISMSLYIKICTTIGFAISCNKKIAQENSNPMIEGLVSAGQAGECVTKLELLENELIMAVSDDEKR